MKKLVWIIAGTVVAGLSIGFFLYSQQNGKPNIQTVVAERGELFQVVNVTGRVQSTERVELAFEQSGRVTQAYIAVGDQVTAGQALVVLASGDLNAQLLQAQANLENERAKLQELQVGTRPEEIQIAETAVANAERNLQDAERNLTNVESKATADLQNDYDVALTAAQEAVTVGKNSLFTLSDIQFAHFNGYASEDTTIEEEKTLAVEALLGAKNGGRFSSQSLGPLKGGAVATVQAAADDPTFSNIDAALDATLDALLKTKAALDAVPLNTKLSATEKSSMATEKNSVSAQVSAVSTKQQDIAVQKAANASSVATAQSDITAKQNALASARDELLLKRAGATSEQIAGQQARVRSVQASIADIQARLNKTILRSPIDGVVTQQDAKVGQITPANAIIVALSSVSQFEIEAFVPEVDIAKIAIGDPGRVTLDAYGDEQVFDTNVVLIDPAETVIEGVSTYKVTLQFVQKDERIKSGMTANIDIQTGQRQDVVVIPQRAVLTENGEKIVQVLRDGEIVRVPVTVGLQGSDGRVEILSGISAGELVITFIEQQ